MNLDAMFDSATPTVINSLSSDSRIKTDRGLYYALNGLTVDGHNFIDQAIANGAVAVVHSQPVTQVEGIEYIQVDDVRDAMHQSASIFYGHPEKTLTIFGITGTNGKTTIAKTLYNILQSDSKQYGYIGTISVEYDGYYQEASLTTPDTLDVFAIYADMVKAGVTHVFQEVSSQGLAMDRVRSEYFSVGVFTNLSHDHLDYHKTMNQYFDAKRTLFVNTKRDYVNVQDEYGALLASDIGAITCGQTPEQDYHVRYIKPDRKGIHATIQHGDKAYTFAAPYHGDFNAMNLALVWMILENEFDMSHHNIINAFESLKPVEGRMNRVKYGGVDIFVDFAHTPDSVASVMSYLKARMDTNASTGRLIAVFGSAGRRDKQKRPVIGSILTQYADQVIFTEDDPRDENLDDIYHDMVDGLKTSNFTHIPKRERAIQSALRQATEGDVVAILGKGADTFMYRGTSKEPYLGDMAIVLQAQKEG